MAGKRKGRRRPGRRSAKEKKEPLRRRVRKEIPVILLAMLLTFVFSSWGLLRQFETTALDVTMRLRHPRSFSEVAVVRITDEVYQSYFGGRSPLDATKLQKLIEAIASGQPKLIAVAIDTSAPSFREVQLPPEPPIVWARDGVFSNIENRFRFFDVLGGREPPPPSGAVVLMKDEDGVVRRYRRLYRTGKESAPVPTLPWEMVRRLSDERTKALKESEEDLLVDYVRSNRVNFPADEVLGLAAEEGYQTKGPLKDKIVILGGNYAAQDEHDTPLGWSLGAEVLAQMVETELQGGGRRPANTLVILVLGVLDGFILLVLFRVLSWGKALLVGVIALPLLALLCSLVAFWSLAQWAYFVPILLLVFLHQLYERGKEYFKKLPDEVAGGLKGESK
jgi:CHASE2 domain-containing sensor protein